MKKSQQIIELQIAVDSLKTQAENMEQYMKSMNEAMLLVAEKFEIIEEILEIEGE